MVERVPEAIETSEAVAYASALADAVRALSRRSPAPRDLPFHGLDHPPGMLGSSLADLADLGIFRHYSEVLVIAAGLGGPARWLARRHGCRVTALAAEPSWARASRILTLRAHLAERVTEIVAVTDLLPFAAEHFTHAWVIDTPFAAAEQHAALREVSRVVRAGGWVGVLGGRSDGRRGSDPTGDDLTAAGFESLEARDLSSLVETDSAIARLVAERVSIQRGGARLHRDPPSAPFLRWKARKPS